MTKNMDEEERQDKRENAKSTNKLRDSLKKGNKSKFKMLLKRWIIALLNIKFGIILLCIFAVIAFLATLTHIADIRGTTDTVDEATKKVIVDNAEIKQAPNPADGYYFQITDQIVEDYLYQLNKAYEEGHYFDHISTGDGKSYDDETETSSESDSPDTTDFDYDPDTARMKEDQLKEWFNSEDFKDYLVKFVRAEIASSYPKIGTYGGNDGTEDKQGNKKDAER